MAINPQSTAPFERSAQVLRLARETGLSARQVRAILNAGEFTVGHATLDGALVALAARVGCRTDQVRAVLDQA